MHVNVNHTFMYDLSMMDASSSSIHLHPSSIHPPSSFIYIHPASTTTTTTTRRRARLLVALLVLLVVYLLEPLLRFLQLVHSRRQQLL